MKVLLVYGGGHAIDDALNEAGIAPRKVDGRRITGPQEIKVIKNVMAGTLGYKIGKTMARLDMDGLCLSVLPASWIDVRFRERENLEDYGHDGTIETVHGDPIAALFESSDFVATPCISVTEKGGVNINADNVAVALAEGCKASKLIFLSDVEGVQIDGKTSSFLTDKDIPALIADGIVTGGMQVKLENCLHAMKNGVSRIHLLNGFRQDALSNEIYRSEGPGTMIISDTKREAYLSEIETEKAMAAQH